MSQDGWRWYESGKITVDAWEITVDAWKSSGWIRRDAALSRLP